MKLSNKEILVIIIIFSSIFLVKSVVEAIDRHKQLEIEELREQVERERFEMERRREQREEERLEIERRREQREEQK